MRWTPAALLAAALVVACSGSPETAEGEGGEGSPQAQPTTPTVPAPAHESAGKVIIPNESPAFPNPAEVAELVAVHPPLGQLTELQQKLTAAVVNSVPAPCIACIDQSVGRCAVDHAAVCPVVPVLVRRATLLAASGEAPNRIREATLVSDLWFDIPADAAPWPTSTGPVRLEVWVDPASSFLTPAVRVLDKLPMDTVSVVVRLLVDPESQASRDLAAGYLAAERQGMGPAWLRAIEQWRTQAREEVRQGKDPLAGDIAPAIALVLEEQGLDRGRWSADRQAAAVERRLASDAALAPTLGVRASPTWFVNGFRLRGAQSDQALGRLIALEAEAITWQASGAHVP